MPIGTQMRMLQVTASLDSILAQSPNDPLQIPSLSGTANFIANDLSGSLAYFARSIQNIHGEKLIGNQVPGLIQMSNNNDIVRRGAHSAAAQKILLEQHDGTTPTGLQFQMTSTATAAASTIYLKNTGGTGADAIKFETAAAGDIFVDSGKDLTLVAAAVLDVDGASLTLDTTGTQAITAGDDITVVAANTKSIFIGEGSGGTATRLEVTHDAGAASNEKIILHNQDGTDPGGAIQLKTAAAGGIKLDSGGLILGEATSGVDFVADGNNSFAIFGSSGGGGNESVMLISSGTTPNAMQLESKGGVSVVPAQGQSVDLGRLSDAQLLVTPHGTAGNRMIQLLNTGGTAATAIELNATAGGVRINAGVQAKIQAASVVLSGSGATAVSVSGDGSMTSGPGGAGMLFGASAEYASFRGKSIFAANTTVVGALNTLADNIAGATATIFSGSVNATVNAGANQTVAKVSGDNTSLLASAGDTKVQVFVNGQLLRSSSIGGVNDYAISATNTLQFQFQLQAGDQVYVIDNS